jgi:hypothetical protein
MGTRKCVVRDSNTANAVTTNQLVQIQRERTEKNAKTIQRKEDSENGRQVRIRSKKTCETSSLKFVVSRRPGQDGSIRPHVLPRVVEEFSLTGGKILTNFLI